MNVLTSTTTIKVSSRMLEQGLVAPLSMLSRNFLYAWWKLLFAKGITAQVSCSRPIVKLLVGLPNFWSCSKFVFCLWIYLHIQIRGQRLLRISSLGRDFFPTHFLPFSRKYIYRHISITISNLGQTQFLLDWALLARFWWVKIKEVFNFTFFILIVYILPKILATFPSEKWRSKKKKRDFEKRKSEISYLSPKSPKDQHTYSKHPGTSEYSGNFKVCQNSPDQII